MPEKTYKILLLMKRRPGMSMAEFREYYETRHAPLAEKYGSGNNRYIRRFLEPQPHPETGVNELPFDVITELWYRDEAEYKATLNYLTTSLMPDEIVADEKNLFDRASFRIVTVEEHESAGERQSIPF